MDGEGADRMHVWGPDAEALLERAFEWTLERAQQDPAPLNAPMGAGELGAGLDHAITRDGVGERRAFELFTQVIAPSSLNGAHPRYFSFIPYGPTNAATAFDVALSGAGLFAGWRLEASGAIYAEDQAVRWIADLAGWPASAGGTFVSGGTQANLSGLFVGREAIRRRAGRRDGEAVAVCAGGHSSLRLAARVLDLEVVEVDADERGRMTVAALERAVAGAAGRVIAVAATAGTTNAGVVDELDGIADRCEREGLWLHVDGAYGGAALADPAARPLFSGIERADSFVVDPHKWLFSTLDSAAIVYRDRADALAALTQHAEYIDAVEQAAEPNASDLAIHMTRRARGLPLWFSLVVNGTAAYGEAVAHGIRLARDAAALVDAAPELDLVLEPELSVVLFRRRGWGRDDYRRWSSEQLAQGLTLTVPTTWNGEYVLRMCFVSPRTTIADVEAVLATLS